MLMAGLLSSLAAQDTTQAYPWRLSYFPYVTASPNDGVMGMARVVWFRQSRWDDRVSVHDQVAVEGGYSTKDSWLLRARGDFPRIGDGWRLQAIAQAESDAAYALAFGASGQSRQLGSVEVTRTVEGPLSVAFRGGVTHTILRHDDIGLPADDETDVRGRLAFVLDERDREYDTRRGFLLQSGVFFGSAGTGYQGSYFLASGWLPLSAATRVTARVGARMMSHAAIDASRAMPAWEDEFVVGGGPESNRALSAGANMNRKVVLASAEVRHDLLTFPGGAIALLAFVDGGEADCGCDNVTVMSGGQAGGISSGDWVVGPGAGVALRLLRNAVLTATVARADGATRVYVSSGWSW